MPKYVNANDASARTLDCYNENNSNKLSKNDEKLLDIEQERNYYALVILLINYI